MKTQFQFVPADYDVVPKMPTWKTVMLLIFVSTGGAVWFLLAFLALGNLASKIAGY